MKAKISKKADGKAWEQGWYCSKSLLELHFHQFWCQFKITPKTKYNGLVGDCQVVASLHIHCYLRLDWKHCTENLTTISSVYRNSTYTVTILDSWVVHALIGTNQIWWECSRISVLYYIYQCWIKRTFIFICNLINNWTFHH